MSTYHVTFSYFVSSERHLLSDAHYEEYKTLLKFRGINYRCFSKLLRACNIISFFNTAPFFVCFWRDSPQWARATSFTRSLDHTQRRTAVGRTPLDEWSARRRDLYLTTRNTHDRHPCPQWNSKPHSHRRAAVDLRLRPRGHWDRHTASLLN